MSRLNPFLVKITDGNPPPELYAKTQILVEPAENHDHNWTSVIDGRQFFWKTKKSAIKNLKRFYGYAEEV